MSFSISCFQYNMMPTQKGRVFLVLLKLKSWDLLKFPHNTRYKLFYTKFYKHIRDQNPKKKKNEVIRK